MFELTIIKKLGFTHKIFSGEEHIHRCKIIIICKGNYLNEDGEILSYSEVDDILAKFKGQNINQILKKNWQNPTIERIAMVLYEMIPLSHSITIETEEGNSVKYEPGIE